MIDGASEAGRPLYSAPASLEFKYVVQTQVVNMSFVEPLGYSLVLFSLLVLLQYVVCGISTLAVVVW